MAKYNDSPVHPEKIKMINEMLQTEPINELWLKFVNLGNYGGTVKEREKAFQEYCHFRDLHLGLKPLVIVPIHSEHKRRC
jgi:hypothetical protein